MDCRTVIWRNSSPSAVSTWITSPCSAGCNGSRPSIDVFVSAHRDIASVRRFFTTALAAHRAPAEVITDRAPALANVIEELIPAAFHNTGQYENNRCEADHGRLKSRLRPMRGLKTERTASVVIQGHAFIQSLRRGHYELGVETAPVFRLATAFDELQLAI